MSTKTKTRLARVQVTGDILGMMLCAGKHPRYMIVQGLPEDGLAELVDVTYDSPTNKLDLVFRHKKFKKLRAGDPIPLLVTEVSRLRDDVSEPSVN